MSPAANCASGNPAKAIPLQTEVLSGYGEDGSQIQRFKRGVPAVNLSVPTRYLHSHNGVLSRKDFDRAVDLVVELIKSLDAATVAEIKDFGY